MSHSKLTHLCSLAILCGLAVSTGGYAGNEAMTNAVDVFFNAMDTNGDGKLSPEEHAAGAKKMFDTMDADKDGVVTSVEMDAAHEKVTGKKTGPGELSSADKIKVIDTTRDGILTTEEHAAGSKMMFDIMDTNKDGFVSKAELTAGHEEMMKKGGE